MDPLPREKSMTKVTRRTMLAGTAGAAAAVASPRSIVAPALAAAPAAGKQAPGFYRYRVGSYEITVVTDGARSFPLPDTFVTNVKKDDVNAALEAVHLPRDTMTLVFNPIVINTGSKLVAIDTGVRCRRGQAEHYPRPVPAESCCCRHRREGDRYRHHLALPPGPCEWPARRR
jgi:hypothetical protein